MRLLCCLCVAAAEVHALLLIAQPQSSSTAALAQLGAMSGLTSRQDFPCKQADRQQLDVCASDRDREPAYPCDYPPTSAFHPISARSAFAAHGDVSHRPR